MHTTDVTDSPHGPSGSSAPQASTEAPPITDDGLQEVALRDVVERARDATVAAGLLVRSASDAAELANAAMRTQLATHPAVTLGAAAGIGFVVAGGLASPAGRVLLRLGARVALGLAVKRLVDELTVTTEEPDEPVHER